MTKRLSDHYKHGHTRYKGQWRKNFAIRTEIYQRWLRSSCPGKKNYMKTIFICVFDIDFKYPWVLHQHKYIVSGSGSDNDKTLPQTTLVN